MTRAELAAMIDHTQVRAYATQQDISRLCDEAGEMGFATVSVNPAWTSFCAKRLAGSGVGINPTIGFPLGANTARIKVEETRDALQNGATEVDMVINIGAMKSGFPKYVEQEIAAVVKAAEGLPVKVILETSYLTGAEKRTVCEISMRAGAAFVKTATGYGKAGATVDDVALMRRLVGDKLGVKAAGGVRVLSDALAMIEAGASRIGTSSGIEIIEELPEDEPEDEE